MSSLNSALPTTAGGTKSSPSSSTKRPPARKSIRSKPSITNNSAASPMLPSSNSWTPPSVSTGAKKEPPKRPIRKTKPHNADWEPHPNLAKHEARSTKRIQFTNDGMYKTEYLHRFGYWYFILG